MNAEQLKEQELMKMQEIVREVRDFLNKKAGELNAPALSCNKSGEIRSEIYMAMSRCNDSLSRMDIQIDNVLYYA